MKPINIKWQQYMFLDKSDYIPNAECGELAKQRLWQGISSKASPQLSLLFSVYNSENVLKPTDG